MRLLRLLEVRPEHARALERIGRPLLRSEALSVATVKRPAKSTVRKAAECAAAEHARRSAPEAWGSDAAFDRAADFFRAAADVMRLKMLARLAEGEWCVTE